MANLRNSRGKGEGFITRGPAQYGGPSRLANWPPRFRDGAETPKVVRYIADEERAQAELRPGGGFRITRGLLTKKDE